MTLPNSDPQLVDYDPLEWTIYVSMIFVIISNLTSIVIIINIITVLHIIFFIIFLIRVILCKRILKYKAHFIFLFIYLKIIHIQNILQHKHKGETLIYIT